MKERKILLAHGAGGKLSHDLINELFLPFLENNILSFLDDSAVIQPLLYWKKVFQQKSLNGSFHP